jgi:hypothetical protein
MLMKGFWAEFMKGDSDQVHTPYAAMAIAFLLASPIIALSCACVIQHVFIMKKGLDGPTVNLLLGMLGAATGGILGAGATMFSKTMAGASSMFSKTTVVSQINKGEAGDGKPPSAKSAPPQEGD